jgi:hypothetical protein
VETLWKRPSRTAPRALMIFYFRFCKMDKRQP